MKSIIVATMVSLLMLSAGCTSTKREVVTQTKYVVIKPPKALFDACPAAPKPPKSETLTNQQVISYINTLYKSLQKCNISMQQIQKFVRDSEVIYK